MDTIFSTFVVSLMENLLTIDRYRGLAHMEQLGSGYGRIAREVCEAASKCYVDIPGVFIETSYDEDRVFVKVPFFKGMFLGETRRPTSVKNLAKLSVNVRHLFFPENYASNEGTSMREIHILMKQCGHVRERELIVKRFPSFVVPQSALVWITTFFNKVVLHCQEKDSFREFLVALVEGKKVETLWLEGFEDKRSTKSPPHWLQRTILKVFLQPQLRELKLSFDHSGWSSSVLCDFLLRDWLWRGKAFPETTKTLEILGALPIDLLRTYDIRSTEEIQDKQECSFPMRCYLLPHPESIERTLELTVFTRHCRTHETLTDEEFIEKANFSRICFHFNRGQNAMYWRTLRTSSITKKPRVRDPCERRPLTHRRNVQAAMIPFLMVFVICLLFSLFFVL
uniref:Mab-21 domain-containing protein n=2 Tax=Steinernema glaseri TaxID=37863 RepID=A0A1I7Z9X9_9BILA